MSRIAIAVIVGSLASACELTPDPHKHAAAGSNAAPPTADAAAPADAAPPDVAAPADAGADAGLAKGDDAPKRDATLDGRLIARCAARNRWPGHAFFHTQRTPFSVLVGTPNHWKWVNHSTPGPKLAHQIEVPLDALLRATGVAGLTPQIDVFVVSGVASDHDLLGELDDDQLNRLIAQHQDAKDEPLEPVRVAHDNHSEGKPLRFEATPGCAATATGHAAPCATPLCPK